jgi:hypothetical protein
MLRGVGDARDHVQDDTGERFEHNTQKKPAKDCFNHYQGIGVLLIDFKRLMIDDGRL